MKGLPDTINGLIGLGILVLGVFWIFFPLLVYSRLGEMVKLLKQIRDNTDATARNTRPPGGPPAESSVKYKIPGL